MAPGADDVVVVHERAPARVELVERYASHQGLGVEANVRRRAGRERVTRPHDQIERLAGRRAMRDEMDQLLAMRSAELFAPVRPRVGLTRDAHEVRAPFGEGRGDARALLGCLTFVVPHARAADLRSEGDLLVDHRAERDEQRAESRRIALEHAEHVDERLDGGDVRLVGLAADPVLARRRGLERVARELRDHGVHSNELPRLPPRSVDHDQRDGTDRRSREDVDGVVARIKEDRGPLGVFERGRERG